MSRELFEAILDEKPIQIKQLVDQKMKEKIREAVEEMEKTVAQEYFLEHQEHEEDDGVENTDDDLDPVTYVDFDDDSEDDEYVEEAYNKDAVDAAIKKDPRIKGKEANKKPKLAREALEESETTAVKVGGEEIGEVTLEKSKSGKPISYSWRHHGSEKTGGAETKKGAIAALRNAHDRHTHQEAMQNDDSFLTMIESIGSVEENAPENSASEKSTKDKLSNSFLSRI